ncbi:MAG: Integrase catalytic region [Ilumatobacteraceae bacterium]|nr:Integrase catalytic region [Ilumatobacteraceae bacterium]
MIRREAKLTVSRFCELIGLSRRAFYERRAQHLAGPTRKGPWPTPALDSIDADVVAIARARPAWGHRKVWARLREDGNADVSMSSVKRAMARRGLLLGAATSSNATRH